jgi:hypothetical protein
METLMPEIGRYQLLSGDIQIPSEDKKSVSMKYQTVFKIDTLTGQVWKFWSAMTPGGELLESFVPIKTQVPVA